MPTRKTISHPQFADLSKYLVELADENRQISDSMKNLAVAATAALSFEIAPPTIKAALEGTRKGRRTLHLLEQDLDHRRDGCGE